MVQRNSCIAIYDDHVQVEKAIRLLLEKGIEADNLSIVGKGGHHEEQPIGFFRVDEPPGFWGMQGVFWGRMWDTLHGAAYFWIPGLDTVVIAGPLVKTLLTVLEGAVVISGLSTLGAALYSLGIPQDSVVRYEAAIKSSHYMLIVHGDHSELERAYELLVTGAARDMTIHLS